MGEALRKKKQGTGKSTEVQRLQFWFDAKIL